MSILLNPGASSILRCRCINEFNQITHSPQSPLNFINHHQFVDVISPCRLLASVDRKLPLSSTICSKKNADTATFEEDNFPGGKNATEELTCVMKFAGSSVATTVRMIEVAQLILSFPEERPVIVLSAMGKTTNKLLLAGEKSVSCGYCNVLEIEELAFIKDLHLRTVKELGIDVSVISEQLEELELPLNGIARLKELTLRTQDKLVSFEECMSTRIFAAYLNKIGRKARQAELETVAKISHNKKNDSKEANNTKPFQLQDVFALENEDLDMETLIDKKDNVFVMSKKKSKYPVLQVDFRLISDLVVLTVSAAIAGIIFSCLGQPVIVGYLLAGSLIGPGGLKFIGEMVQVETVAQFGVVFLLFALGLEFSLLKLKAVGAVAVFGGLLQIFILIFLCGIIALLCGAKMSEGVFVGCFLSMSSTAVVVKFLVEQNINNSLNGQVTIGTLIFQDCAVGLLFALLPVLGGNSGFLQGIFSMGKLLVTLSMYLAVASALTRSFVPWFLKLMMQLSSQTNELYQLAAVAFCLMSAWCSDKLGLSLELGSFVAGLMISTTEFAQHTLKEVEPIRNFFAALFLSSIGMLINVQFLWAHIDILLASVILVVVVKTTVAAGITKAFGYSLKTSMIVGISLAQIGEFAFVLLSRATNLHLIEGKMYLLLLGTTAFSLVTTPVLFKLIPAVLHLGVLMHWLPSENAINNTEKVPMIQIT